MVAAASGLVLGALGVAYLTRPGATWAGLRIRVEPKVADFSYVYLQVTNIGQPDEFEVQVEEISGLERARHGFTDDPYYTGWLGPNEVIPKDHEFIRSQRIGQGGIGNAGLISLWRARQTNVPHNLFQLVRAGSRSPTYVRATNDVLPRMEFRCRVISASGGSEVYRFTVIGGHGMGGMFVSTSNDPALYEKWLSHRATAFVRTAESYLKDASQEDKSRLRANARLFLQNYRSWCGDADLPAADAGMAELVTTFTAVRERLERRARLGG